MTDQATTTKELHQAWRKPKRRTIAAAVAHKVKAQEGANAGEMAARSESGARRGKRNSNAPLTATFCAVQPKEGEVVFVLPLPPKKLSPNGRGLYWMAKAKAIKAYRQQCAQLMAQSPQQPFTGRVVVDLEFYLCRLANDKTSYYPKDEDNARGSMKAAQDALKDAGIIPGDGKKFVRMGKTALYTRVKEHKGLTCVVMTIRKEVD